MKFIYFYLFIFLFSFASAELNIGYDVENNVDNVILNIPEVPTNYSTINVNNSNYLQGYSPLTLYSYYQGLLETYFNDVYCKLTGCTMSGDLTVEGTTNLTGTTLMTTGNTFIRDVEDETHHLNVDLENLDELYANVFLTPLIIETFYNATGDYINITADQDETSITVNLAKENSANNYRLSYTNVVLPLTAGTNETPILNRIYIYLDGDTPTWVVSTTEPTVKHAMASRVLLGDTGTNPYSASLQEDGQEGFLKRVQRVNRKEGLLYESGFDYVADNNDLEINNGSYINGIYDQSFVGPINVTEGFYTIDSDGVYRWRNSFDDIEFYSSGESIGSNKYYNVMFGVTPYDGTGNIHAIIQSDPSVEYTSMVDAYADDDNTFSVFPSEEFLKTFFIPVGRMIMINAPGGTEAQILPNGRYIEDYRGGIAGGISSGGGLSEQDPIWTVDKPNYVPYEFGSGNINGSGNIMTTGVITSSYIDITDDLDVSGDISIGAGNPITWGSGHGEIEAGATDDVMTFNVAPDNLALTLHGVTEVADFNDWDIDTTGDINVGKITGTNPVWIGSANTGTFRTSTPTALTGEYVDISSSTTARQAIQGSFAVQTFLNTGGALDAKRLDQAMFNDNTFRWFTVEDDGSTVPITPLSMDITSGRVDWTSDGQYVAFFHGNRQDTRAGIRISNEVPTPSVTSGVLIDFDCETIVQGRTVGLIEAFWDVSLTDATRTGSLLFSSVNSGTRYDNLRLGAETAGGQNYAKIVTGTDLKVEDDALVEGNLFVNNNLNVSGNYVHDGNTGFTGTCINVTYSGGIAVSCND